jgi:hypothetical protein
MKISFDGNKVSSERIRVNTTAKKVLVFRATDCEVDMNLGRVIVTCKRFSVHERNLRKNENNG